MITSVWEASGLPFEELIEILEYWLDGYVHLNPDSSLRDALQRYHQLQQVPGGVSGMSPEQQRRFYETRQGIELLASKVQASFRALPGTSDAQEILAARDLGILDIQTFDFTDLDRFAEQYAELVFGTLNNASTYPMFDQSIGSIVQAGVESGDINLSAATRKLASHISFATDVLQRLPAFEDASISELYDIRNELRPPLVRFRSALAEYSREIESEPWSQDFQKEAEFIYRQRIEPAVLDLEEAIESNSLLRKFRTDLLNQQPSKTAVGLGSFLGIALSSAADISGAIAAAVGGGAVAGAQSIQDVYQEWKSTQKELGRNALFFYYQTGITLKGKSGGDGGRG